jgi:hypothetical protein
LGLKRHVGTSSKKQRSAIGLLKKYTIYDDFLGIYRALIPNSSIPYDRMHRRTVNDDEGCRRSLGLWWIIRAAYFLPDPPGR